jgi:pyrimidine operon attenuation protein/uracil phosphoribosyltransferase
MNELFDYGRPAAILLATLVDRGGRTPIAAQFVSHVDIPANQVLVLEASRRSLGHAGGSGE